MKKILILSPYPKGTAGSQRFRYEQYIHELEKKGHKVTHQSFLDEETWKILYQPGQSIKKALGLVKGFLRRIKVIFKATSFDYILIHREATPVGPPLVEWMLAKALRKKIIYDFDDAIWNENTTKSNFIISFLKFPQKVGMTCRWAYKVSVGNQYLADFALTHNQQVIVNPTTIDTEGLHYPRPFKSKQVIVGWTGTHSTLKYLDDIQDILAKLQEKYDFKVKIIADQRPQNFSPDYDFVPWNKTTEIEDLNQMDIGIMPLTDDKWCKGKCGFKALQYMALEKPVLAAPVGVNEEIIVDGETGFHCLNTDDWNHNLIKLLDHDELRKRMGKKGREKIVKEYSVLSNTENFLNLFE